MFFAIDQGFGALGPVSYGFLVGDGSDPTALMWGYLMAAAIRAASPPGAALLPPDR